MNITYFFRKKNPNFHSIEGIFENIITQLKPQLNILEYRQEHGSHSILDVIKNGLKSRKKQGDVNHITGDIHYICMFLAKRKTILTVHDIGSASSPNYLKNIVIKWLWFYLPIRSVEKITVVSEFSKRQLMENYNYLTEDKIVVIPNPISSRFEFEPKKDIDKNRPSILHIGTKSNKNIERLIKALEEIPCRLTIIGELSSKQKELLHDSEQEYENYFNITFEELKQFYEACDIVSFISTYEGFGMPIIEANAVGRVVVTSNVASMPEVAADAALMVNPFSELEIREGIKKVIEEDGLRNELIEKGRKNAERFDIKQISKSYIELYKLVNGG